MKKTLFFIAVAIAVAIAGYFVWRNLSKKDEVEDFETEDSQKRLIIDDTPIQKEEVEDLAEMVAETYDNSDDIELQVAYVVGIGDKTLFAVKHGTELPFVRFNKMKNNQSTVIVPDGNFQGTYTLDHLNHWEGVNNGYKSGHVAYVVVKENFFLGDKKENRINPNSNIILRP